MNGAGEPRGTQAAARLGIVILAVEDLQRAATFYNRLFAWPHQVDSPSYIELLLPEGMRLGLYDRHGFARNTGQAPVPVPSGDIAATELYLYVDDVAATLARATAVGGRLLSPAAPRDWGDEVAYLTDPDGNVVALARPSRAA